MSVIELNQASIADVGPAEPTYDARPQIIVEEDREKVFRLVACAVSMLKEIRPCIIESDGVLRHAVTRQPITEEWLSVYLPKAIDFLYMPPHDKQDGQVPYWLPRMILQRVQDFSDHMWFVRY